MNMMAFTKVGMRSKVDSHEGPFEVVQVESGTVLAVPLLFRGRTCAFALFMARMRMDAV